MLLKPISFLKKVSGGGGGSPLITANFDGASDYVAVSNSTALGGSAVTTWAGALVFFGNSTSNAYVLAAGNIRTYVQILSNGDLNIQGKNSGNTIVFAFNNDASATGINFDDGSLHELLWIYNGGSSLVYIDGADRSTDISTDTSSDSIDLTNADWGLAARSNGTSLLTGGIKLARMWDDQDPDLSSSSVRASMVADTVALGSPLMNMGFATLGEWNTTDIDLGDTSSQWDMTGTVT